VLSATASFPLLLLSSAVGCKYKEVFIMKKIKQQPVVTTSTDLHGEKIPLDVLQQFFEEFPDPWLLNNNHDLSKPPIGIWL